MESKFIFIFLTLIIYFKNAHCACVPRDAAKTCPNPNAPPNVRPVKPPGNDPLGSPPVAPKAPTSNDPVVVDAVLNGLPQASGNENPEIKKICDATDYPDVCLSTLGRYNGPSDIATVLGIAIQAGMDFANAALGTADKLTSQTGTPPDQVALLSDCKDSYDDASYNFQNAHDALPAKDVGTMNTMLSAAITDAGDCVDSYEGLDCPLANFSDKLRMMASNCLAMISQMNKPAA